MFKQIERLIVIKVLSPIAEAIANYAEDLERLNRFNSTQCWEEFNDFDFINEEVTK